MRGFCSHAVALALVFGTAARLQAADESEVAQLKTTVKQLHAKLNRLEKRVEKLERSNQQLEQQLRATGSVKCAAGHPIPSSGKPVTAKTPLKAGDVLQVEWGGQWWAGKVLNVSAKGDVKIHYLGWASSWDEVVPRSQLQIDPKADVKAGLR